MEWIIRYIMPTGEQIVTTITTDEDVIPCLPQKGDRISFGELPVNVKHRLISFSGKFITLTLEYV